MVAADRILECTRGLSFAQYEQDWRVRSIVERQFSIIGEALNRALRADPAMSFTGMRRIIDFRNILIRGYDAVDHAVVWGIVQRHLPLLRTEASEMLDALGPPGP